MAGFRYLPWRLKLGWFLAAIGGFLFFNWTVLKLFKSNDLLIFSEQAAEIRAKADSLIRLSNDIDSSREVFDASLDSIKFVKDQVVSLTSESELLRLQLQAIRDSIDSIKDSVKRAAKKGTATQ